MDNTAFPDWLADEMRRRGWGRAEVSRRAGIARAQVARLLSGENNPGPDSLRGLAAAFDMPVEAVMRQAGILPDTGEVLAEARAWSGRLRALSPGRREALIRAIDLLLEIRADSRLAQICLRALPPHLDNGVYGRVAGSQQQ